MKIIGAIGAGERGRLTSRPAAARKPRGGAMFRAKHPEG